MFTEEVKKFIIKQLNMLSDSNFLNIAPISEGKSGAEVYKINIISKTKSNSGSYIVKLIDTTSPWYDRNENEGTKSHAIMIDSNKFNDRLVQNRADRVVDDKHIIIYSFSNDSELQSVSLEKLEKQRQTEWLARISYEILSKFNDPINIYKYDGSFFEELLSYRIEKNGSFETKSKNILTDVDKHEINVDGVSYPNPYYFIKNKDLWEEKITTPIFKSRLHGDLHRKNIIASKTLGANKESNFVIIDYDSYKKEAPMLFDHAYLELSCYMETFPDNDPREWVSAIEEIVNTDILTEADLCDNVLAFAAKGIYQGIRKWCLSEEFKQSQDAVRIQFTMARIAAGINYFSKKVFQSIPDLRRLMLYIAINFKMLFSYIGYEWMISDYTTFKTDISGKNYIDDIWKESKHFDFSFTKVLLTTDKYTESDYDTLLPISRINWSLVIDVGSNAAPKDLYSKIVSSLNKRRTVYTHTSDRSKVAGNIAKDTCSWIDAKNMGDDAIGTQWKKTSYIAKRDFRAIMALSPLKPFLFVFDCQTSKIYAEIFTQFLLEDEVSLPKGSRFIVLGTSLSDDNVKTLEENGYKYKFIQDANLIDVAKTVDQYFSAEDAEYSKEIMLPSLDHLSGHITENEYANYSSTFEIVYNGLAARSEECDYGQAFYRGEDIKWIDLSNHVDYPVLPDYQDKLEALKNKLERTMPRVQTLRLCHSAGSGGTTLSKRLLWDIKDMYPSIYLKKYTSRTASNIVELYHKTGKTIFAVFEFGSTIMTEEEFENLKAEVNSNSARVVFMRVERMHSFSSDIQYDEENEAGTNQQEPFITIEYDLPMPIAEGFYHHYQLMTNESQRIECLKNITYRKTDEEWAGQCCPFFYGFYTFQEEYNIDRFISRTIEICSDKNKALLSDMALLTIYSQNLYISYDELVSRLELDTEQKSPYLAHENFDEAIVKLIIRRDDGWRLCNVLIAQRVLQIIYSKADYKEAIYDALKGLIERLSDIYPDDSPYVHSMIKELVIDRSYIDGEKTKFSDIISDIAELSRRQKIFETLIELYPNNPHYYNHLGRLYTNREPYDFDKAINRLEEAIDIAKKDGEWNAYPHCTTLACIYSKKIKDYLKRIRTDKYNRRLIPDTETILLEITMEYEIASNLFLEGRKANRHNSYGYFPNISMICTIIEGIVNCDKEDRNLNQLLSENKQFRLWYDKNICKAIQLINLMESNCYDTKEANFIQISKATLEGLLENLSDLNRRLNIVANETSRDAVYTRRTCINSIYARKGYTWDKLDYRELETIKNGMMQNLYVSDSRDSYRSHDVIFWFEAYRRLPEFEESEAISVINDYMEDNYRKSYLLYILEFSRYVKGVCGVSELKRHMANCSKYSSQEYGLKTSAYIDTYIDGNVAFPIVDVRSVSRNDGDNFERLKLFKGKITDIQGTTKGYIKVDDLNIEVMFTPSFSDIGGNKREFTSNNITDNVEFNLMFTYSGIRAWDVKLSKD